MANPISTLCSQCELADECNQPCEDSLIEIDRHDYFEQAPYKSRGTVSTWYSPRNYLLTNQTSD